MSHPTGHDLNREMAQRKQPRRRGAHSMDPERLADAGKEALEGLKERTETGHRAAGRRPPSESSAARTIGAHRVIDDTIREFLLPIAAGRIGSFRLPWPLQDVTDSVALLITTGFLPQRFRDEMKLDWNRSKQRDFDRLIATIRLGNTFAPAVVRNFPFNVLLHDVNWRMRTGRPLV